MVWLNNGRFEKKGIYITHNGALVLPTGGKCEAFYPKKKRNLCGRFWIQIHIRISEFDLGMIRADICPD